MLKLYVNRTDITANVRPRTLKIGDTLNNTKNTLAFKMQNGDITEGQEVELWQGASITADAGSASVVVDNTFTFAEFWHAGQVLVIDPYESTEEKVTVLGWNSGTATLTFTQNLAYSHLANAFIAEKKFGGIIQKQPQSDIGQGQDDPEMIEVSVTSTDYAGLFDRKVVAETFAEQYPREVIGRIAYKFASDDDNVDIDLMNWVVGESDTTRDTTLKIGDVSGVLKTRAVKFTASEDHTLGVKLYKHGFNGSPENDLRIALHADDAGEPSATELTYYNLPASVFSKFQNDTEIRIPLGQDLTPTSDYWIVVSTTDEGTNVGYELQAHTGASGKYKDDAGAWTNDSAGLSFAVLYVDGWTAGGVLSNFTAGVVFPENDERIEGNNCLKLRMSGAGTGTLEKTLDSAVDCSEMDKVRFWHYVGNTDKLTGLTLKIGTDSSNFYEFDCEHIESECWHYESFNFDEATITGSPSKTTIGWARFEWAVTGAVGIGDLRVDCLFGAQGGFTIKNTDRGTVKLYDYRVQYQKPSVAIEKMAKTANWFWYVDYFKDIHFFSQGNAIEAPFSITDTSENFGNLTITADISSLKNRQVVRGGKAVAENYYTQNYATDGVAESWMLDYPPKDVHIYEDRLGTGTFTERTVGVANLNDASDYDYLFDFNGQTIQRGSADIMPADGILQTKYLPYKPIRVRVEDNESIEAMQALTGGDGIYDGAAITDETLLTWEDARTRAKAEINAYKNPIVTITFITEKEGLQSGQLLTVVNTKHGINGQYLIQSITATEQGDGSFNFSVTASSTLFGITEFLQLIFNRSNKVLIDTTEVVDIIKDLDEEIELGEQYRLTLAPGVFYAMGYAEDQTPRDAFADFSETCDGDVDLSADEVVVV